MLLSRRLVTDINNINKVALLIVLEEIKPISSQEEVKKNVFIR